MARPNKLTAVQVVPSLDDAYSLDVSWLSNRNETLPVIRYEIRYIDPGLKVSEFTARTWTPYRMLGRNPGACCEL